MSNKKNFVRCTNPPCGRWVKTLIEGICPACMIAQNGKSMLAARKAFPRGLKP